MTYSQINPTKVGGFKMDKKEILRQKVIDTSHTPNSSELARQYFSILGLRIESINLNQCEILSDYIQKNIDILLKDSSYSIIDGLKMYPKIKVGSGIFLFVDGYYFKKRQAISFEYSDDLKHKFIGFCGWASGCNRIPFIKGFIEWCDYITERKEGGNGIPPTNKLVGILPKEL